MKCPCGSRRTYKDCCAPAHQGAWARSAVDLASARLSAALLRQTKYLVDTTHPDSMAKMGSSSRLQREMDSYSKRYQALRARSVDMCAGRVGDEEHEERRGGTQEDEECWLVATVVELTDPEDNENKGRELLLDKYKKHEGQWMFFAGSRSIPTTQPFTSFCEKHSSLFVSSSDGESEEEGGGSSTEANDDPSATCSQTWRSKAGQQSDGSDWPYFFDLVSPSYAPHGSAEDEVLGPWLWDEFATEDGQAAAPPAGGQRHPRRRQLVYLDDHAPSLPQPQEVATLSQEQQQQLLAMTGEDLSDAEGLSVRRAALLNHRLIQELRGLRNPGADRRGERMHRSGR